MLFAKNKSARRRGVVLKKVFNHPIIRLYFSSEDARVHIGLLVTLTLGVLYSAFNALLAVYYGSLFYGWVALYYLVLVGIRSSVFYINKREYKRPSSSPIHKELRLLGIAMLLVNIAMMSIIIYNLRAGNAKERSLLVIIVLSVYSAIMLAASLVSIIRGRRGESSSLYITARTISFSASLISLFNLWDSVANRLFLNGAQYASRTVMLPLAIIAVFLNLGVITGCIFPEKSYNENSGKNR